MAKSVYFQVDYLKRQKRVDSRNRFQETFSRKVSDRLVQENQEEKTNDLTNLEADLA